jgi:hypothetical protein
MILDGEKPVARPALIRFNHHGNQIGKRSFAFPAKLQFSFRAVAAKGIHFGRFIMDPMSTGHHRRVTDYAKRW